MRRLAIFVYGVIAYLGFLGVFLYLLAFLANFAVPKSIDSGPTNPIWIATSVDVVLIVLFGLQHSVMSRLGFKVWWTRFVPASIERSTYVMASNLALVAFCALWEPIDSILWDVRAPLARAALWALFLAGAALVVFSTFLINHFDLFGLRQVWTRFRGTAHAGLRFRTPLLYRYVRHPIYLGWSITFLATPTLSLGHLLFAVGMIAYMRIAIRFEERDLMAAHPEYAEYRQRVPMIVPRIG
jgi:protein-S-isoprenylcysteine O-methyltransferase Ste14